MQKHTLCMQALHRSPTVRTLRGIQLAREQKMGFRHVYHRGATRMILKDRCPCLPLEAPRRDMHLRGAVGRAL